MAAYKTYLQLVNKVMVRMRENEVASVSSNILSKLYGELVNKAKKTVEMSWNWEGLRQRTTIATVNGDSDYSLVGIGSDFREINVWNDTADIWMTPMVSQQYGEWFILNTPQTGKPEYFYFDKLDTNGDVIMHLYPVPDGVYSIKLDIVAPYSELVSDSDKVYVPWEPVLEFAVAYAIRERGEDGGQAAMEAYMSAERSLQDWIATEAARRPSELIWTPV